MKGLIFVCLFGAAMGATISLIGRGAPYVWDLQKVRMDAAGVGALLNQKTQDQYPTYNGIPETSFDCEKKKMPGYYADVETQCQVYHRCDINGNMTSYICDNTTVYDQVTLVCDYWFNVDCSRTAEVEYFANRRLYQTELPLFDDPPADYVAPQSGSSSSSQQSGAGSNNSGAKTPASSGKQIAGQKPVAGGQVSAKATVKPVAGGGGAASAKTSVSGKNAQTYGKVSVITSSAGSGQSQTEGDAEASANNEQQSTEASAEM